MLNFYEFLRLALLELKDFLTEIKFTWYNGNTTSFFLYLTIATGGSLVFSHMWQKGKGLY